MMRRFCFLLIALAVSACSTIDMPSCPPPTAGDVVYVVARDWHAEIGIPVEELDENMAFYRDVFPGARVIMFGYGKKTFFTAPPQTVSEYFLGPIPGPAVMQAVALNVMPTEAYPPEDTITLLLPPGGSRALSEYLWNDLAKDAAGKPQITAPSTNPDGLFYASQSAYNLSHTCNTWAADALHAAGLPISGDGVVFSSQVMTQTAAAAEDQCRLVR
ncbi:MAG: DUF2459 domain-containing protein [Alphaproteobacteria bacterium]